MSFLTHFDHRITVACFTDIRGAYTVQTPFPSYFLNFKTMDLSLFCFSLSRAALSFAI